jgi:thermitase
LVRNARPEKDTSISRLGENVNIPKFYNLMLLTVPPSTDIPGLCRKLEELPYILHAEPDYLMKIKDAPAPDDTHFNQQDGWEQTSDVDIDLLRAWDFTRGSTDIRVGIVDTGIDYHNPDLGNGSFGAGFKVAGGYDYFSDDSDPDDSNAGSHGSNVAGIVAAEGNNGTGVTGVAGGDASAGNLGVSLIALRVGESTVSVSNAVEAIYDASTSVNQGGFGCHVLNYSAGDYTASDISRKAISYAVQNGVIFVAAKGNDNSTNLHYPSDYADNLVISVGAFDNSDFKSNFSNFGNNMDFVAPGTADLLFTTARVEEGSYTGMEGTSGAVPVVTGIAGLLKSII